MPVMGPTSGKWGVAVQTGTALSTCRNWSVNSIADTKAFAASNTKGGMGRRLGRVDWSGTFEQYVSEPDVAEMMPGDIFDFIGFIGPRAGSPEGLPEGPYCSGAAIIDNVALNINWDTGDIILFTTNFSSNGELFFSNVDDVFHDDDAPDAFPSSGALLEVAGWTAGSELEWVGLCAKQLTLTISSDNKPYANSCTGGFVKRTPGNIDWTCTFVLDEPDLVGGLPAWFKPNQYVALRIWIDGVRFWFLKWGLVKSFTNFTVDRESAKIIDYTVTVDMSVDGGPDSGANGEIFLPGGVIPWFPVANA